NATLLEAAQDLERIRALAARDRERWLRTMLANNLVDRIRRELAKGRDYRLERPLEAAVEESSCRLRDWVAADQSTPSEQAIRQEQALRLAEAIILHKWHGWKLAQIAGHLGCTVGVVAGLQARGLARLRETLPPDVLEGS